MLVWVRKLLENWVARVFFALLIAIFVFWGVSGVVTLIGNNTAVAHAAGHAIDITAVQAQYQKALDQAEQSGQPDLATRQQIASAALTSALRQIELQTEENALGVTAPDDAIRQAIDSLPAFQTNGVFDEARFNQVLQANNTTPGAFIGQVKDEVAGRQLVEAVTAGAAAPAELVNQLFGAVAEQRFAESVQIPFAAQPAPPPPPDPVLQRYWRNHPAAFTAPAYRTIKLVILSPQLLAPQERVAQSDIDAAYARATINQPTIAQRSVQVLVVPDLAASSQLEDAWKHGAPWSTMQSMAKTYGANAIELDQASQRQIPSPALGAAVFAAAPGQVTGPIAGPLGMYVFKVTGQSTSGPDEVALKAQIKQQLQLQQAQADVAQDVDNLQDALAGQTPLDRLPGNLGLVALQGTLDANGNTLDGSPAPIPGGADLKNAIIKAAFATPVNSQPQLTNGPDDSYFALTVDSITPPSVQPYAQAMQKVLAAWTQDEIAREAETKAANLLAAVNGGQNFDAAANAAGFATSMSPPVTRNAPANGITPQLTSVLFTLKPGQATMLQTANGFTVTALAKIVQPTPAQDPGDYAQLRQALEKSLQNDDGESFLAGLQARDHVTVDQKMFAQIYQ
jgi:peptidyl-prolyl cis-trans isomerase D